MKPALGHETILPSPHTGFRLAGCRHDRHRSQTVIAHTCFCGEPRFATVASSRTLSAAVTPNLIPERLAVRRHSRTHGNPKRIGLVAQGIFADLSRRHHHMRMVIANIAGVMRRMDLEIHRCAIAIGQILRERARRLRRQLMRKRDLELTADTRVLALFRKLRRIPQGRTVQSPIGGNAWPRKDDLAMLDALFSGEVMHKPVALVSRSVPRPTTPMAGDAS